MDDGGLKPANLLVRKRGHVVGTPELVISGVTLMERPNVQGQLSEPLEDSETKSSETFNKLSEAESSCLRDITYLNDICRKVKALKSLDDHEFKSIAKRTVLYLVSEYQCIRAISIRILRLICVDEKALAVLLRLRVDLFLSRSLALDLYAQNDEERIEALKLAAVMLQIYTRNGDRYGINRNQDKAKVINQEEKDSKDLILQKDDFVFPKSVLLSIFMISKPTFCEPVNDMSHRKYDRLALPCFAVFLETAVTDPLLIIETAGTGWIVDALLIPDNNKWVSVLVCRILCLWLDHPKLRAEAKLNTVLEQIFAPIIEIGFFQGATIGELKVSEERIQDLLDSCFEVLLNLLRTWSGLYSCASSDRYGKTVVASPFRLLEYLGCGTVVNKNLKKMRDLIVKLCCELMDCPYAGKSFETWTEAVKFYSKKDFPDSYKSSLREDFILAEHEYSLSASEGFSKQVDLLKSFRSMILFFLIDAGVLRALIRLILFDPEDPLSLKATLLLGDLILMGSLYLPLEWRLRVLSVPTLVQRICETFTNNAAVAAVNGEFSNAADLDKCTFLHSGSGPLLLYRLDILNNIALSARARSTFTGLIQFFVQPVKLGNIREYSSSKAGANGGKRDDANDIETLIHSHLSAMQELDGKPCWTTVNSILQILENDEHACVARHKLYERLRPFFSQIFSYFLPSSGHFVDSNDSSRFSVALFIRCLILVVPQCTSDNFLDELVTSFLKDFVDLISPDKLSTDIFSLANLYNSNSMYYFAFIGTISSMEYGQTLLEKTNVLQT
uniref:RICTOR_N domain-containing protein n=1 Tax=Syphacia muris TaxID=451379 RepID=A0A0N5AA47_9BILA